MIVDAVQNDTVLFCTLKTLCSRQINPGKMTLDDLARYRAVYRKPLTFTYKDATVTVELPLSVTIVNLMNREFLCPLQV